MNETYDPFSDVWNQIWQIETNQYVIVDENDIQITVNKKMAVIYRSIFAGIGFFIFLINLPVVISSGLILKRGLQQPKSTYLLLGNISMSDLVTGSCLIIMQLTPLRLRSQTMCFVSISTSVGSTLSSVYSVAYIAIDRYLFIVHGMKYNQWVRPIRIRILMAITWIIGLFLGYTLMMGWSRDDFNGQVCLAFTIGSDEYKIMITILLQLPLIVSCVFHFIILQKAIKRILKMRSDSNANLKNNSKSSLKLRVFRGGTQSKDQEVGKTCKTPANSPSTYKAIKVVFFTAGSFLITLIPFLWTSFLYLLCDPVVSKAKCEKLKYLCALPFQLLFIANAVLNPIIYAWWHKGFRKAIKKMYLKRFNKDQIHQDNKIPKYNTTISSQGSNSTNVS